MKMCFCGRPRKPWEQKKRGKTQNRGNFPPRFPRFGRTKKTSYSLHVFWRENIFFFSLNRSKNNRKWRGGVTKGAKKSRAPNGATKGKKQLFIVYKIAAKWRIFFRREAAKIFWVKKSSHGSHGFLENIVVPTVFWFPRFQKPKCHTGFIITSGFLTSRSFGFGFSYSATVINSDSEFGFGFSHSNKFGFRIRIQSSPQ